MLAGGSRAREGVEGAAGEQRLTLDGRVVLVDEVGLDELDGQARLSDTAAADDYQLVFSQELGIGSARDGGMEGWRDGGMGGELGRRGGRGAHLGCHCVGVCVCDYARWCRGSWGSVLEAVLEEAGRSGAGCGDPREAEAEAGRCLCRQGRWQEESVGLRGGQQKQLGPVVLEGRGRLLGVGFTWELSGCLERRGRSL